MLCSFLCTRCSRQLTAQCLPDQVESKHALDPPSVIVCTGLKQLHVHVHARWPMTSTHAA